ncbi:nitroreductase/quinone reductase family protein [Streptomyces aurantiogriseus]|uniref:nitroreductase/quinone reductase family protein n=1 Tax=Streptomyces aurantiogriseus TaxID=66870 RepID=UPI00167BDB9B|nr:nitroreductase/quinone reductase family protein [Streptomyces aurantiogriseus]
MNRIVLALLRSRWQAAVPGLCALAFLGRRTGRPVTLPVQYAREDDQLVVLAGRAADKQWWRNFTQPHEVGVLVDRVTYEGIGRLVPVGHPGRIAAERAYGRRHPHVRISRDDPLIVVTLSSDGVPSAEPKRSGPVGEPSAPAGLRLWGQWWRWTTLGEAAGFCVPAAAGAIASDASTAIAWPMLVAAGTAEGALLGAAQAHVLARVMPDLRPRRWVAATAVAAGFAWMLGLLPSLVAPRVGFSPAVAGLAAVDGVLVLLSLGTAQWWVLHRHVTDAWKWIPATAAAWLAGLAVFFSVTMPLWQPGQSPLLIAGIGVLAGLLMAGTVAAVTGWALVRLLR